MAWKLRKDKLKTDESEAATAISAAPEAMPAETEADRPAIDLDHDVAGTGTHGEIAAPADDLQFTDDGPDFLEELKRLAAQSEETPLPSRQEPISFESEPIATQPEPLVLEAEPIAMGAFAPYQPPASREPEFAPEPVPEFDPVVAPSSPALEPEAIALTPPVVEPEAAPSPEPVAEAVIAPPPAPDVPAAPIFDVSAQREAVAAGLVTTETESGVPKVAPFILDAPASSGTEEAARIHNIVLRLGNLSATYFLVKEVTTVGRPDSSVQNYPDIEVELDDGVSRRHAEIRRQDGRYFLVDVGSTNGTILNGEMLAADQPVPLQPGDRIRIGERTELLFE